DTLHHGQDAASKRHALHAELHPLRWRNFPILEGLDHGPDHLGHLHFDRVDRRYCHLMRHVMYPLSFGRSTEQQARAVLGLTVPRSVRAFFLSWPSTVPVVAAAGEPAGASPV